MSRTPSEFARPGRGGPERAPVLLPGGMVGQGRYRLLSAAGVDRRGAAHLWRAKDGQLGREVALTILLGVRGEGQPDDQVRQAVDQAALAANYVHPGTSRILDVLSSGHGVAPNEPIDVIVSAAWAPGGPLTEHLARGPVPPDAVCRLLGPLAAAVDGAHRSGCVLGVEDPQRIRVTPEGGLRLAFPGPPPQTTAQDDVVGLGALLYLLLTGHWPLPDGPPDLPQAPRDGYGTALAPDRLHPGAPEPLSSLAVRSLAVGAAGTPVTAAEIVRALDAMAQAEAPTVQLPTVQLPAVDAEPGEQLAAAGEAPTESRPAGTGTVVGGVLLVVATLAVAVWVGSQVLGFFTVEHTSHHTAEHPAAPVPPPQNRVQPSAVAVYNVAGDADRANTANLAIDGNPTSGWRTDTYLQDFPVFKPGIGLMLTFAQPVLLNNATVTSPSAGATVEVRTSPSDNPDLNEARPVGQAALSAGDTRIPLRMGQPTQHVLVWVTGLAGGGQGWSAELDQLAFTAAQ